MSEQITDTLMMIRPVAFHLNEETAVNNYYQKIIAGLTTDEIQRQSLQEFDAFVTRLKGEGIEVIVFDDTAEPVTPDSIFPNNWISFQDSGDVTLYPMYAPNRRLERREDIIETLSGSHLISGRTSFTSWENENKFLEGTGSLVLDRPNRLAYAAVSERTHRDVLNDFANRTGFTVISFRANQNVRGQRLPIYHTNVMMCVGDAFAVLCDGSIDDPGERDKVIHSLNATGKEVIYITENQKERFAGNMLQVKNRSGEKYIVMSASAYKSLAENQRIKLAKHGKLLRSSLDTIESLGGGSARCMMAEVFLPKREHR